MHLRMMTQNPAVSEFFHIHSCVSQDPSLKLPVDKEGPHVGTFGSCWYMQVHRSKINGMVVEGRKLLFGQPTPVLNIFKICFTSNW